MTKAEIIKKADSLDPYGDYKDKAIVISSLLQECNQFDLTTMPDADMTPRAWWEWFEDLPLNPPCKWYKVLTSNDKLNELVWLDIQGVLSTCTLNNKDTVCILDETGIVTFVATSAVLIYSGDGTKIYANVI